MIKLTFYVLDAACEMNLSVVNLKYIHLKYITFQIILLFQLCITPKSNCTIFKLQLEVVY